MVINPEDDALIRRFPRNFQFGVATAAYQIEGAAEEDGRRPSIWDAFSHTPGRVLNGDTGDVACDHYHRWAEDVDLIKSLGVDAYRFSVAWPRIIPTGDGPINPKGLDFYDRLVDRLCEKGISPHLTLHHWDLPLDLHGWGGWTARRSAYAFADLTRAVIERLGDRLAAVATINEPWCVTVLSYLIGLHAPGERNMEATLASIHTVNLAHGLAVDALRSVRSDLPVGIVMNAEPVIPATDSPEDVEAARRRHLFHNGLFCDPIFAGAYPEEVMTAVGHLFPKIEPGDLEIISRPLDFFGINYYMPQRVAHAPEEEYPHTRVTGAPAGSSTSAMGWEIEPKGLGHLVRLLSRDWKLPPIWITENGCAMPDRTVDGKVDDQDRLAFLRAHLTEIADLIDAGFDIRGYLAWSLMDNFEWSKGYSCRFGLVHVDYETQVRTVKASGAWYRDLIGRRTNAG